MRKTVNQNTVYRKPRKNLKRGKLQNTKNVEMVRAGQGLLRKISSLVYALISGLFVLCLMLSSANAESLKWDPEDILEIFMAENYPWDEIDVSNVRVNGKLGNTAPEHITVEKGPVGKGVFSFLFEDGRRVIVMARVKAYGQVVRSTRPYRKGHRVKAEDLYVSRMDIRKMPGGAVKDPVSIIGKSLKRSVSANRPIVENMIETSQTVKRGKRVFLIISQGGLSITAYGKIKEKGYIGMPVKAMNLSSKKEVVGVLIDENTVEVEL